MIARLVLIVMTLATTQPVGAQPASSGSSDRV